MRFSSSKILALLLLASAACTGGFGYREVPTEADPEVPSSPMPGSFGPTPPRGPLPPPKGPQPQFGPTVEAAEPPPPISGGTLAITPDGRLAVAADPDRDRIYVVGLETSKLLFVAQLPRHSEPGRVALDDRGAAHVVLRRSGGVASVDLASGALTRRDACTTPRGLVFDKGAEALRVTCATGQIVTVPLDEGRAVTVLEVARDLRDIAMHSDGTFVVSRFRTAEVLHVDATGRILPGAERTKTPRNLAWRTMVAKNPSCTTNGNECEDEVVVQQAPSDDPVSTGPSGYGSSGCSKPGPVSVVVEKIGGGSVRLATAVLPVDLASNGSELAIVSAGNAFTPGLTQITRIPRSTLAQAPSGGVTSTPVPCTVGSPGLVDGQAIAAAYRSDLLVVQTREPASLQVLRSDLGKPAVPVTSIVLASDSVKDTGHAIFHANAGGGVACASCHAEGGDDGHVWNFAKLGPRRTPSLQGTLEGTAPFHWDGDMRTLRELVDHVFVERMSGPKVDDNQLHALERWLYAIPAPAKLHPNARASSRGALLFAERCAGCHAGAKHTNNMTVDVGTGGRFQVPSLVGVGWRSPFLHSGCARTLADRFSPSCGGAEHGQTADLDAAKIADLVGFLEPL